MKPEALSFLIYIILELVQTIRILHEKISISHKTNIQDSYSRPKVCHVILKFNAS